MRRVVQLPDRGRLIVATDVQGNLGDFNRIAEVFEEAARRPEGATLVVTGDLVHGPELTYEQWPDYLGTYYEGNSKMVLDRAHALASRYPGRVHYLLGNHEHSHVGGPIVSKFFPDEARRLEELMGVDGTRRMRAWLQTWPFVAVAKQARIVMLHAAPHAKIKSGDDLERLSLDGFFDSDGNPAMGPGLPLNSTLGALLWARTATAERGYAFLHALEPDACVALYGHDVAREGFASDHEPLLCVSTSFGCYDGDKLYLDWDLSVPAESAAEVARLGLRPLHPDAPPVHRPTEG